MIDWTDDVLDDPDMSAPTEVLQKWAISAANSFDDLDILITGIDAKIAELSERRAVLAERKSKRAANLLKYVSQLPNKELEVGVDKFKVKESSATKVLVLDATAIPVDYCKYAIKTNYAGFQSIPDGINLFGEVKIEPDLTAIKKALESDVHVSGAELVNNAPSILRNGKGLK